MNNQRAEPLGPLVYRNVAFTIETFDRLKDFQRELEQAEGRTVTNSEALAN